MINAKEYIEQFEAAKAEKLRVEEQLRSQQVAKGKYKGVKLRRSPRKRGEQVTASAYIHPLNVLLQSLTISNEEDQ